MTSVGTSSVDCVPVDEGSPRSAVVPRPVGHGEPVPPFDAVYEAHFDYVWRCTRALGVGEDAVDDVAQEVFVVVHRRLPEYDPRRASLRTWLYGITLRIARRHRYRARPVVDAETVEQVSTVSTPFEATERQRKLELLERCLAGLTREKREVFVLSEIEQLSGPEVAAATGANLNTVYARLRAARREVREALDHHRQREGTP